MDGAPVLCPVLFTHACADSLTITVYMKCISTHANWYRKLFPPFLKSKCDAEKCSFAADQLFLVDVHSVNLMNVLFTMFTSAVCFSDGPRI